MKKISCRMMGGPCDTMFMGSTPKEVIDQGMAHLMSSKDPVHMEMAAKVKTMSKEDGEKWNTMFMETWAKTPDSM